jgi:hypothetical protein
MKSVRATLGLLVAVGLLGLPATGAKGDDVRPEAALNDACNPPCGYIMPTMDIVIEGKERCGDAFSGDPTGCPLLMEVEGSETYAATVVWHWDVTQDGTYPADPNQDIVITFAGIATNPAWLEFSTEPSELVITAADLADPANYRIDPESPGGPKVEFWMSWTVDITITRTAEPSAGELDRVYNKGGLVTYAVKARSTESGSYFKRGFTLEEFRYDGRELFAAPAADDNESPGLGTAFLVGALAIAFVAARRKA